MKQYNYSSYDEYIQCQIEANRLKENNVFVTKDDIDLVDSRATSILCHGTRNGAEQKLFAKKYPKATILGTEISPTAHKYDMTIQHDFNEPLDGYGLFDIVFSNAFDHSYNPDKTMELWLSQLALDGYLYISYSFHRFNNVSSKSDPLELSQEEMDQLIKAAGGHIVWKKLAGTEAYMYKIGRKCAAD